MVWYIYKFGYGSNSFEIHFHRFLRFKGFGILQLWYFGLVLLCFRIRCNLCKFTKEKCCHEMILGVTFVIEYGVFVYLFDLRWNFCTEPLTFYCTKWN